MIGTEQEQAKREKHNEEAAHKAYIASLEKAIRNGRMADTRE